MNAATAAATTAAAAGGCSGGTGQVGSAAAEEVRVVGGGGGEACGARWALGALLLAPLAAAGAGYVTVPAIIVLGVAMLFAAFTCSDLRQLSEIVPPRKTSRGRRERNLRSFGDFLATWLWFLAHLAAVAVCARVLSATADHVTAGRVRRWLFGYETRALGEPWPDVLGVTVVLVVCAMFMCGLEESMMFTFMLLGLLYVFNQLFAIFGLINFDFSNLHMPASVTGYELFAAGAPISYTFSVLYPRGGGGGGGGRGSRRLLVATGLPLVVLAGLCFLYTNILNGHSVDAALPVTTLLEALAAGWMCPLLAAVTVAGVCLALTELCPTLCMYRHSVDAALPVTTLLEALAAGWMCPLLAAVTVAGVCLALTELCPALFAVLVALASPEWKVLTRSMTYESATTGSPVLAVFTAGSLAAILAFACPLSHMVTLLNASHLLGISIQAFQLTIMRCVPTDEQEEKGDVEYKRLGADRAGAARARSGLWFLPRAVRPRHSNTIDNIKAKLNKECEERECLLLAEYGAGGAGGACGAELSAEGGSAEGAGGADDASDADAASGVSSGDDSTDIDAVVKEYRDTVKVVTAIPVAGGGVTRVAGRRGARLAAAGALLALLGAVLAAAALCSRAGGGLLAAAIPVWMLGTLVAAAQPAHKLESWWLQSVEGPVSLLLVILFLAPLLLDSWPAVLLFAAAGLVIYARCERWCGDLAIQRVRRGSGNRKLHHTSAAPGISHVDTLYISR